MVTLTENFGSPPTPSGLVPWGIALVSLLLRERSLLQQLPLGLGPARSAVSHRRELAGTVNCVGLSNRCQFADSQTVRGR